MHALIVDDEVGIRDGLAAFLRLRGHRIVTAGCVADGLASVSTEQFDVVVTDWNLPDGDAGPIVERTGCPCLVMSGDPGVVADERSGLHVLAKPVLPDHLAELLESWQDAAVVEVPTESSLRPTLPFDTATLIELIESFCGELAIHDDGRYVTVEAEAPDVDVVDTLARIGGDLRRQSLGDGYRVVIRLERDGRPAGVERTIAPREPWPDDVEEVAIDFDRGPCSPPELIRLIDGIANESRPIHFLNLPPHLRLFVDALGRSAELPKREVSGPRLPEVLSRLWS